MREILFRGKRVDNGEWVHGAYYKQDMFYGDPCVKHYIITSNEHPGYDQALEYIEVKPETVGRLIEGPCYDGVWDENRKFFEGDIIGVYRDKRSDIDHQEPDSIAVVVNESCITENGLGRWFPQDTIKTKVIGNVYDNPELVSKKYAEVFIFYHCLKEEKQK